MSTTADIILSAVFAYLISWLFLFGIYDLGPFEYLEEKTWGKITLRILFLLAPVTLSVCVLIWLFYYLALLFKWFFCIE